jgi:hypothetical protein
MATVCILEIIWKNLVVLGSSEENASWESRLLIYALFIYNLSQLLQ